MWWAAPLFCSAQTQFESHRSIASLPPSFPRMVSTPTTPHTHTQSSDAPHLLTHCSYPIPVGCFNLVTTVAQDDPPPPRPRPSLRSRPAFAQAKALGRARHGAAVGLLAFAPLAPAPLARTALPRPRARCCSLCPRRLGDGTSQGRRCTRSTRVGTTAARAEKTQRRRSLG